MKKCEPKIAFIGWNPFQLIHVSELIKQIPNSIFILENKHNSLSQFDKALLSRPEVPVQTYRSKDIHKLDNLYDIVVCQTAFTDIHRFNKAKIAMIQYGYAKEPHNFGAWRSLADICFTYGPYASEKISYFCPTTEIGHARKEEIEKTSFILESQQKFRDLLKPNKKTILYLPTWGELNSSKEYLSTVLSLQDNYNVIVKIHHNTDLLSLKSSRKKKKQAHAFLGANDDSLQLIAISDVIISDYSGAIFDAVFCKKPIILLNSKIIFKGSDKVDEYSIEYRRRNELGYNVDRPEDLINAVEDSLSDNKYLLANELYEHLYFSDKINTYKKIHEGLVKLNQVDNSGLSQQQLYIRQEIKKLYKAKYSSLKYKALNNLLSFYSKVIK